MPFIALGLFAGCVHYEPKPLVPATAATEFESRTLTNSNLRGFFLTNAPSEAAEWPPRSWGLRQLALAALYYQPDMEEATAKLAATEAAITTAGGRPNPTFSFSPTYSERPLEFFSPWTLGFVMDLPVETASKRGYRLSQARHQANSARLNVATTAWQVRSRVRQSLLDLYAATVSQDLLSRQQAGQARIVEAMEDRFNAGQSSFFEVQSVRTAAVQTTLQLRDAQKQRSQARLRLAKALGLPENAVRNLTLSFRTFDRLPKLEDAGLLRREALLNRPDMCGALADYQASQAALQLEIARQYPDFHLGPGYTWNQGVNNYSLGFSVALPILNQNQGPIAEAEAHRRQALTAFTALAARVICEVDAASAGYRDALRKLETANGLLAAERERLEAVQESFAAGASERLELLQTQSEFQSGELARAAAVIEAQQALGSLEDAIKRPIDATSGAPAILDFGPEPANQEARP